jgi:hypothetical protein
MALFLEIIDKHHVFIQCWSQSLFLKIDYELRKVTILSKFDIELPNVEIFADQSNNHKCVIFDRRVFFTGSLVGDELVFSTRQKCNFYPYQWPKLDANHFIGFRNLNPENDEQVETWQLCDTNLDTLTENIIDLPSDSSMRKRFPRLYVISLIDSNNTLF